MTKVDWYYIVVIVLMSTIIRILWSIAETQEKIHEYFSESDIEIIEYAQ